MMGRACIRRFTIAIAGGLLITLGAACGDDSSNEDPVIDEETTAPALDEEDLTESPEETSSASEGGEGTYAWETMDGAVMDYTIPAPADDPEIQRIEAFRSATGAAPVTYAFVEIDNSNGAVQAFTPAIDVVTADGQTFTFDEAWLIVGDWSDDIPLDDVDLLSEGDDVYNSLLNRSAPERGARSAAIFAAEGALPDVARVFSQGSSADGSNELAKVDA